MATAPWRPRVMIVAAVVAGSVVSADASAGAPWCAQPRAGSLVAFTRRPQIVADVVAVPLRAREGSLSRENAAATEDGLTRLATGHVVKRFRRARLLVSVPASTTTYYVSGVPGSLRVTRPWTKRFIEHVAAAKHRSFGTPLRITGLTRTRAYQRALRLSNGNAAPAHGRVQSTHLTGASVDISTRSLPRQELGWLRAVLRRLTAGGFVHAIEEFRQPHFHVLVRKRYGVFGGVSPVTGRCRPRATSGDVAGSLPTTRSSRSTPALR